MSTKKRQSLCVAALVNGWLSLSKRNCW